MSPSAPNIRSHLQPFGSRRSKGAWLIAASVLVAFDQAVKFALASYLPLQASIEVTPWFNLVHVLNPGAAFSFLADAGGWQRHVLTAIGVIVSAALAVWLWRGVADRLEAVGFTTIIGGALGNVIDRMRLGAVVDYLDLHWRDWHWPAFNLADILVVGGALVLVLAGVMQQRERISRAHRAAP